jgi:RNA polymerase sigma factor (sigma-70 family)
MVEMQDKSDAQLLRDYAEGGREPAFREIVTRHTDLVYSAALRQVGSPDLACDLTQGVFTDLARKAPPLAEKLADDSSLVGWLYRSTRFAALKHLRDDRRRLAHERQAMEQLLTNSETAPDWEQVRPVLDEAMADLNDEDREAVLLRFFKNCDFHAVGQSLGVSEAAAQKRVSRALDKLRELLSRRGITTSAAALSVVLTANAVQAAPVGLAVTISTAAALGGTTLAVATTATAATTKAIAMTTMQKTVIGATLAAAVGTGIYEAQQASTLQTQVRSLQQQQAPLTNQVQQLTGENMELSRKLAAAANKPFNWQSVESSDYKQYIANLRAIGCPEQTIRDIIVTDVDRTYWQRMAKARPSGGRNYWEAPIPRSEWNKKNAEYASLQVEKRAVLRELLGSDFEELRREGQPATFEEGFEFLPAEKRRQLREIDHQASIREIESEANGRNRGNEIEKWKKAEIKKLLTPEELNEYEMRSSQHGNGLAQMARGFEPSEQEFRTIFEIEKQFGINYNWVLGTTGYAQRKPADAEKEQRFQSALQQALGIERYAAYQRSLDPNYLILYDIARNDGLPKDTLLKAYELNRAAEQQAAALRSDVSLLGEARQAALRQLEEQTDKDIAKLLGNGVLKRFRSGQQDAALYPAKLGR